MGWAVGRDDIILTYGIDVKLEPPLLNTPADLTVNIVATPELK